MSGIKASMGNGVTLFALAPVAPRVELRGDRGAVMHSFRGFRMRCWLMWLALMTVACGSPEYWAAEASETDAGPYVCNPMTCPGCCSGNVCRSGDEFLACGYSGRACRECSRGTQCVSPGTCAMDPGDSVGAPFNPDAPIRTDPYSGMPAPRPGECIPTLNGYYCTGN